MTTISSQLIYSSSSTSSFSVKLLHHGSPYSNKQMIKCKKVVEDSSSLVVFDHTFPANHYFSNKSTYLSLTNFEAPPSVPLTIRPITTPAAAAIVIDQENAASATQRRRLFPNGDLMPKHVAVIMDGHGRWAKNHGLPTKYGHYMGFMVKLREMILSCIRHGIRVLTVYSFSSENWSRPKEEIDFLMSTFEELIQSHIKDLIFTRHDLRFSVIGDRTKLPKNLQRAILSAEELSKSNKGLHFVMAISYSGQDEVTEAVKNIAERIEEGTLEAKDIDKNVLERHLQTYQTVEFPNADLLIRTSGELRLSNFMLWQCAYAEFYFCDKLLPDFEENDLVDAFVAFQRRKRRYGGRNV